MFYSLFWLTLAIYTIISLLDKRWGLYLLLALLPAFLLRLKLGWIPTTWLELAIYILAIVNVGRLIYQHKLKEEIKKLYHNFRQPLFLLLVWLLIALLATLTSPNLIRSAGALKGWWFDPLLLLLIALITFKTYQDLEKIIWALLSSATLVSAYGLIEYIFSFGMQADGLLNSFFKPANYVAMLIVPIIILGLGYFLSLPTNKQKTAMGLLLGINVTSLVFTQSIGGFLGIALGVLTLILFIPQTKKRQQAIKFYLLLSFLAAALLFTTPKIQRLIHSPQTSSLATRSQIWQTATALIKEHPIKGIGLGNFESPYRQTVARLFKAPLEWEVVKAHNLYLNLWLEMGLLGLIWFFVLIFYFGKELKKILTNISPSAKIWWQLAGSSAALVSILTHGLVDTPYFKNDLSIVFLFVWIWPFWLSVIYKNNKIDFDKNDQM